MKCVATAELQTSASFEHPVNSKPQLGIFRGDDVDASMKEISQEITHLIPDLGVRNASLAAVQEIRYAGGSAELHFLCGPRNTEEWTTKEVMMIESLPQQELQMRIDELIARYYKKVNWDAASIW